MLRAQYRARHTLASAASKLYSPVPGPRYFIPSSEGTLKSCSVDRSESSDYGPERTLCVPVGFAGKLNQKSRRSFLQLPSFDFQGFVSCVWSPGVRSQHAVKIIRPIKRGLSAPFFFELARKLIVGSCRNDRSRKSEHFFYFIRPEIFFFYFIGRPRPFPTGREY